MTNADSPIGIRSYDKATENGFVKEQSVGLTKREYFAVMALQGILSNTDSVIYIDSSPERAVEFADSLIQALNKKP